MIIEYTVSGKESVVGNGWVCYTRDLFSLSAIFWELHKVVEQNKDVEFAALKEIITEAYREKTAKSKCSIYKDGDCINICKPNKLMPHIWISKK